MRRPTAPGAPTSATIDVLIPKGQDRLGPLAVPILAAGWTTDDLFNLVVRVALAPATRTALPQVDARTVARALHRFYGDRLFSQFGIRRRHPSRLLFDGMPENGQQDRFPSDRLGASCPAPYATWPEGFDAPVGAGWTDWTPPQHGAEFAPF